MTQKRYTEIPKRQKCINKEEPYIGGAIDIVDDTLGKPQSQVNQERIEDVATLDGKVSTEKTRAEGVEGGLNTRLQTVEQLAEISIGGGDAQIATASDFDNPDSAKRAKIPTVGAVLDGISEGVFNLTAKTGDSYASLQDALTAANTAIPANKKKGGMQLSFVQSSDNKYIQYRCMAQNFTTDVTQWQGVDENPIVGSKNLIESNGVIMQTFELNSERGIVHNNTLLFDNTQVNVGDEVNYDFTTNSGMSGRIDLYDEQENLLLRVGRASTTGTNNHFAGTLTIPDNFHHALAKTEINNYFTITKLYSQHSFLAHEENVKLLEDGYLKCLLSEKGKYTGDVGNKIAFQESASVYYIKLNIKALREGDLLYFYGRTGDILITTDVNDIIIRKVIFTQSESATLNPVSIEQNESYLYIDSNIGITPYVIVPNGVGVINGAIQDSEHRCMDYSDKLFDSVYSIMEEETVNNNQELFSIAPYAKIGDIIYYDVESVSGGIAYIELLDGSDNLIAGYGIGSSKNYAQFANGTFTIPTGFVRARIKCNSGKTATIHILKSNKSISSIREDLDNVIQDNQNLSSFIGYENKIAGFSVAWGGYVYIPVSNIFTEKEIDYVVELQILSNVSVNSAAIVFLTQAQSSGSTNAIRLGYIYDTEITNHIKKSFTFKKGDFDINYIRIYNSNFTYNSTISINYSLNSGTNAILNTTKVRFDNEEWHEKIFLDNRLANPVYISREKFNIDNPDSQIIPQTVFTKGSGSQSRIPISIITNDGTELLASTFSASGPVEYGKTSIDVARKNPTTGDWEITRVFDYRVYGQFFNLSFVVDRTGVHGAIGRIYLLSACGVSNNTETFDPDNYTPVPAAQISYAQSDLLYSYSDDDGLTWNSPISLKTLWSADEYNMVTPAPNTGIQLANGTLIIPLFNLKDGTRYSGILYKKPNEDWEISSSVPITYHQGNECVAVEVTTNIPTLYIRNENIQDYDVNNKNYIEGSGDQIYKYSFADDDWTKINSTFNPVCSCQFSIIKCVINSNTLYLRSAIDTYNNSRINITVWVSLDCEKWLKVYRVYAPAGNGYSSLYEYNGKLIISYEKETSIDYQDITDIIPVINDSLKYLSSNISIQDRMQILFNKLNGID